MTETQALVLVNAIEAAYPRQSLKEGTVKVYVECLKDLDYEVASRVVYSHIRSERWFPTVAEIREACVEMVHVIPTTESAMEIIRTSVQNHNYQAIKENHLFRQAVATVGFDKIGYSEYPEPLYRQVKEAYENIRKREIRNLQNTPAVGMLGQGEQNKALEG